MRFLGSLNLLSSASQAALAGFGLFFVLGSSAFIGYRHLSSEVKQPIAFNHKKHVESGLSCTDCHAGVQTQARATLPDLATCLTCHESALTQSPEEARVRAAAAAGKELNWVRLTQVPPHVFFSHRRHVKTVNLACAECHGPMEKATVPPSRAWRTLNMDACIECHQRNRVNADCNDCHR